MIKPVYLLVLLWYSVVPSEGALSDAVKQEIQAHKADVNRIIDYVMNKDGKHQAITKLAELTDKFGPRSTGSQALEDATDFSLTELASQNFTNVHSEDVTADKWVRNEESATLITPRRHVMSMMSLGSSIPANLTAEVEVVASFEEMDQKVAENADFFKDKIILFNQVWVDYSTTVAYRNGGAARAAPYGPVAVLIRSVTPFSIFSPHTGAQKYNESIKKIPIAAISVEDAHQIQRYRDRGETVEVELIMRCERFDDPVTVRNVIAEWPGTKYPDEVVIIGGHLDSWDVGFGVMDDGGGVIISWQALLNLKALDLKPKRTIRALLWTAEEIGLIGAKKYFEDHKDDNESISLIMESDYGTFKPRGLGFSGTDDARDIMKEIVSLLKDGPVNAEGVTTSGSSPDTGMWIDIGVPGANLWNQNDKYFYYHHSHGDSITMEDPDDLDLCAIVWTVVAYVVANLEDKLPRTNTVTVKPDVDHAHRIGAQYDVIAFCALLAVVYLRKQLK